MLKTHCKAGHEYTKANTYIDKKNKRRQCRACNALRHKNNYVANGKRNRPTLKGLIHGTLNGYANYGCRCELCRVAKNAWRQERYRIRPELKQKAIEYSKQWYKDNPEKVKAAKLASHEKHKIQYRTKNLLVNYGIDLEGYDALFKSQDYSCASCLIKWQKGTKYFAVDHNHITGKIRGILCSKCNTALGLLNDNEKTIMQLLNYVKGK